MIWLCLGVLWWILVHLVPAAAPSVRQALVSKLGENAYKGLFALDIVIALVMIVYGWRHTVAEIVYVPPTWGYESALPLMAISVFLFGAARRKSAVKQFIRHPQLTGLLLWSVAHLLANGEQRSLILFGGLGIWSMLEMVLINRRDGEWVKEAAPPMSRDLISAVIAVVVMAVLIYLHPYFTGVPLTFN